MKDFHQNWALGRLIWLRCVRQIEKETNHAAGVQIRRGDDVNLGNNNCKEKEGVEPTDSSENNLTVKK